MFTPDQIADAREGFDEFLTDGGQVCDIHRPAESADSLGATIRGFATVIATNVPCVVISPEFGRSLQFGDLADISVEELMDEVLLPAATDVRVGDQIITRGVTYSVRKIDTVNTHLLVQHVWTLRYARTA